MLNNNMRDAKRSNAKNELAKSLEQGGATGKLLYVKKVPNQVDA